MKFLPENKRKSLWSIIFLAVAVGGIFYVNLVLKPGASPVAVSDTEVKRATPRPTNVGQPAAPGEEAPSAPKLPSRGGLLPYGNKLDQSILEGEAFQVLKSPPAFGIGQDELGKSDPFSHE